MDTFIIHAVPLILEILLFSKSAAHHSSLFFKHPDTSRILPYRYTTMDQPLGGECRQGRIQGGGGPGGQDPPLLGDPQTS